MAAHYEYTDARLKSDARDLARAAKFLRGWYWSVLVTATGATLLVHGRRRDTPNSMDTLRMVL